MVHFISFHSPWCFICQILFYTTFTLIVFFILFLIILKVATMVRVLEYDVLLTSCVCMILLKKVHWYYTIPLKSLLMTN